MYDALRSHMPAALHELKIMYRFVHFTLLITLIELKLNTFILSHTLN